MQKQLPQSDYAQGDETGGRENGQSGRLRSFSTPRPRAGQVETHVLGEQSPGVVASDFYAGYNTHFGLPPRCWVHLWRDGHARKALVSPPRRSLPGQRIARYL